MNIALDTHTLFWFTTHDKRISEGAKIAIRGASKIYIPTIVLMELFYLMRKQNLEEQFPKLTNQIKASKKYSIVSLDMAIVEILIKRHFQLEMHDNIIATTAYTLSVPLITKDREIQKVYQNIIW